MKDGKINLMFLVLLINILTTTNEGCSQRPDGICIKCDTTSQLLSVVDAHCYVCPTPTTRRLDEMNLIDNILTRGPKDEFEKRKLENVICYHIKYSTASPFNVSLSVDEDTNWPFICEEREVDLTAASPAMKYIFGSRECYDNTTNCPNGYYEDQGVCYKGQCPINMYYKSDSNPLKRICECSYGSYKGSADTDRKYCLAKNQPCPTEYKYYTLNNGKRECKSSDSEITGKDYKRIEYIDGIENIQYLDRCNGDEFYDSAASTPRECLKKCPEGTFIKLGSDGSPTGECIVCATDAYGDPPIKAFINRKDGICYKNTCNTPLKLMKTNYYECYDGSQCPEISYPYLHMKSSTCLDQCSTAIVNTVGEIASKAYSGPSAANEGKTIKVCLNKCSDIGLYENSGGGECMAKCRENEYLYKNFCLLFSEVSAKGGKYCTDDTQICYDDIPEGYYKQDSSTSTPKLVYKDCILAGTDKIYHNVAGHYCEDCKTTAAATTPDKVIVYQDTTRKCYSKCPDDHPYYLKTKINGADYWVCFNSTNPTKGCSEVVMNGKTYFYHTDINPYHCLSKCDGATLSSGTWDADKFQTDDFICLSDTKCPQSHPYNYEKRCYKNNCPDANNMISYNDTTTGQVICYYSHQCPVDTKGYIQNGQCVESCEQYNFTYKIEKISTTTIGHCLKKMEECYNFGYFYFKYENGIKTCLDSCATNYQIEDEKGTAHPIFRENGTCVDACPSDFPYEIKDAPTPKKCYKKCPDEAPFHVLGEFICADKCGTISASLYEYINGLCVYDCNAFNVSDYTISDVVNMKCRQNCSEQGLYLNDSKCFSSCPAAFDEKYFYHPITHQCTSICKNFSVYQYTPKATGPCLNDCPKDSYYSDDLKICKDKCDDDEYYSLTSSSDPKSRYKCVKQCGSNEVLDITKRKCIVKETSGDCKFFYYNTSMNNITTKVCVESCNLIGNYIQLDNSNECVPICPQNKPFVSDGVCYSACPDDFPFYINHTQMYNCSSKCPTGYFHNDGEGFCMSISSCRAPYNYIHGNGNDQTCYQNCSDDAPFYKRIGDNFVCNKTCFTDSEVSSNYQCYDYCGNQTDKTGFIYFYIKNRTCLKGCPEDMPYYKYVSGTGYGYYECLKECAFDEYVFPNKTCVKYVDTTSSPCPENYNFVGKDRKCLERCDPKIDGKYYRFKALNSNDPPKGYYECIDTCQEYQYEQDDGIICVPSCNSYPLNNSLALYQSPSGFCRKRCYDDPIYKYSNKYNDTHYYCVESCGVTSNPYYDDDFVCNSTCNKVVDPTGHCIDRCNDGNHPLFKFTDNSTTPKRCVSQCPTGTPNYNTFDYICRENCSEGYNHLWHDGSCHDHCDKNSRYPFDSINNTIRNGDFGNVICLEHCPLEQVYYEKEKVCLDHCEPGDYLLEGTRICVNNCTDKYPYKYRQESTPPTTDHAYDNFTCVTNCKGTYDFPFTGVNKTCLKSCPSDYPYYKETDLFCIHTCPEGYATQADELHPGTFKCTSKCVMNSALTLYMDWNGTCVSNCNDSLYGYYFFNEGDNVCVPNCSDTTYTYYATGTDKRNMCVKHCYTTDLPHSNINRNCTKDCEGDQKFFIGAFVHGEVDLESHCLFDCPKDYPYIRVDELDVKNNECYANCSETKLRYHKNETMSNTSRFCMEKCEGNYPFEGDDYECLKNCTDAKPYYVDPLPEGGNNLCRERCPPGYYHIPNDYRCTEDCSTQTFNELYKKHDYDTQTCVQNCTTPYWAYNGSKIICLNNCTAPFGTYITPNFECVFNCDNSTETDGKFLMSKDDDKHCECQNLYYIDDDSLQTICIDSSIYDCYDSGTDYKYVMEKNLKRCLKQCNTVLFEGKCQEKMECPDKTIPIRSTDHAPSDASIPYEVFFPRECSCQFLWYRNAVNKTVCLEEDEECPYNLTYIKGTECVSSCGTDIPSFQKICMKNGCNDYEKYIQLNGTDSSICETKPGFYWYWKAKLYFAFTESENCPEDFPFLIEDTKECVAKCQGKYYILYGNKCVTGCQKIGNNTDDDTDDGVTLKITEDSPLFGFANYTCQCSHQWYYNASKVNAIVCLEVEQNCSDLNLNPPLPYQVKKTKQCVEKCPEDYPYIFNKDCYKNCEEEASVYVGFELTNVENPKTCKCPYLWEKTYDENPPGTNSYMVRCIPDNYCNGTAENYLLMHDTFECRNSTICPPEYVQINNDCFLPAKCHSVTKTNHTEKNYYIFGECLCDNLWYNYTDPNSEIVEKYCMDEKIKECPAFDFPYQIVHTKQCVKECPEDYFAFNWKCYQFECPENTIPDPTNPDSKVCVCNTLLGVWYKVRNDTEQRDYLVCAVNKTYCSNGNFKKEHIVNDTNECLQYCEEQNLLTSELDQKCYKTCPDKTNLIPGTKICQIRTLDSTESLEQLYNQVVDDLYIFYDANKEFKRGGFLYEKFNTSLQIYVVNKQTKGNYTLTTRNNLSMIQLDDCLNDLYKINDLGDTDDIIITKYDIHNSSDDYMIHPVEYEIYAPKWKRKIDASICEMGSIIVSYPVKYGIRDHSAKIPEATAEYLEKVFTFAKELHSKNNKIDLFNYESPVYHDICVGLELNGKDLVMVDRRNILYPNITVCENNCTPYYTNYELERFYCKCAAKTEFNFTREHFNVIHNFTDDESHKMQEGPTTFPIVECIKNLKDDTKNALTENTVFYITISVFATEIAMIFVSVFYGYQALMTKIGKKLDLNNDKDNISQNTVRTGNNENDEPGSSQRSFSEIAPPNPPRKNDKETDKKNTEINTNKKDPKKTKENLVIIDDKNEDPLKVTKLPPIQKKQALYGTNLDKANKRYIYASTDEEPDDDEEIEEQTRVDNTDESLARAIKFEEKMLRETYEITVKKDKNNVFVVIVTELIDKLYLVKTFFLHKKFDIISCLVAAYLLYHMLILTCCAMFFDVKAIRKIYNTKGFPDAKHYLLYGAISLIIAWVGYALLLWLVRVEQKIKYLFEVKKILEKKEEECTEIIETKFDRLTCTIKNRIIAFYIIVIVVMSFCFLYLVSYCGVYTGTRRYVFTAYGITLCEICCIKFVYGLILGILRYVSIYTKCKCLYSTVRFFDAYLT